MAGNLKRIGVQVFPDASLVDISVDDDLSAAIDIREYAFGGIQVPATHNGTSIGFVVSVDGTTYATLKTDANAAITIVTSDATASAHPLPAELFAFNYFKISPGTQSTTDTQYLVALQS